MIAELRRPLPPLATPQMLAVPTPLANPQIRLHVPKVAPSRHPRVNKATNLVSLWIVTAGRYEYVFNDLDAASEFRDEWNAENLPNPDEASIRSAACVVSDLYQPRERCGMLAAEVPVEIISSVVERCAANGVNPHRLISALLLNALNQMSGSGKTGEAMIRALEGWEGGRRRFKPLQSP